ncbi:unnamed protein product [Prunus brigantina]
MAVGMLDLSSQGRCRGSQVGHGSNFDRHRHSRVHLLIRWMRLLGWGSPLFWRAWSDSVMYSKLLTRSEKEKLFSAYQGGYKKDVERCFGIIQARWVIIRGATCMFDEEVLRSIMMTCIILHNMIVEDEYNYDAPNVFEPDPMNMALTRIYERLMRTNGQPLEHEPLVRDGRFMNRMID